MREASPLWHLHLDLVKVAGFMPAFSQPPPRRATGPLSDVQTTEGRAFEETLLRPEYSFQA